MKNGFNLICMKHYSKIALFNVLHTEMEIYN